MRDWHSIASSTVFSLFDGFTAGPRGAAAGKQPETAGADMANALRALLASSDAAEKQAVELFICRVSREIGSLAAALQGMDALVFTGGLGENTLAIRSAICAAVRWLGAFTVAVVATDEEQVIARQACSVLAQHEAIAAA